MMRNDKTPVFAEINIKREITAYQVACLLASGMEGGINYWARIIDYKKPEKLEMTLDKLSAVVYGKSVDDNTIYKHIDYVLNPGGEVHIQAFEEHNTCHPKWVFDSLTPREGYQEKCDSNGVKYLERSGYDWTEDEDGVYVCPVCGKRTPTYILTHDSLRKGLEVMREKVPNQFEAIGTGREDATTGDVFIQCCLFGELVYG